jgi:hypothetical protein
MAMHALCDSEEKEIPLQTKELNHQTQISHLHQEPQQTPNPSIKTKVKQNVLENRQVFPA